MRKVISKYSFFPVCALAFFIPLLPKILPWITVIIILFFLVEENIKAVFKKLNGNKYPLLFMAVYLFYLAGMIYSENKVFGWNDLGMKLSLFLFPVFLAGKKIGSTNGFKLALKAFVTGCCLSAVILIIRACYLFFSKNQNAFFYESFSFYMHPTYLAMYFNFAIAVLLLGGDSINKFARYQKIIFSLILSAAIVLISSKAGLLGLVLVFIVSFIVFAVSRRKAKFVFLLAIILGGIYFILNYFIDQHQNRFKTLEHILDKKGLDKTSSESSMSRIFVWKSCTELIKAHPVFGVGTGDIKDELIKLYQQNGITGALTKKLNAHNQFLQTAVALGLIGCLILTASLFLPLVRFFILKEWLYVAFLLLIIFNFLFESMLERQDGIMFYAFFNALLFFEAENKMRT